jgi:hypothetical protein
MAVMDPYIPDTPAFAELKKLFDEQGVEDPMSTTYKAVDDFGECEILHRKAERAKKLKLPKGDYYERMAMLHNKQGLRRVKAAKAQIKKVLKAYPLELEKTLSKKQIGELLDEHEMMFKNELFEQDLPAVEVEEIYDVYRAAKQIAKAKGGKGLLKHVEAKLDQVAKGRTNLKKGRGPGSPIAWWKIAAIAALAAFSVWAFWWCYTYSNCAFAWQMIPLELRFVASCLMAAC